MRANCTARSETRNVSCQTGAALKNIERENLVIDLDIAELDIKTATLDFQRKTSQGETKKSLQLTQIATTLYLLK